MQMDVEFVNKYIEIITKKLEEFSTKEMMLLTHVEVMKERISKLESVPSVELTEAREKIQHLEADINDLNDKLSAPSVSRRRPVGCATG